MTKRQIIAVDVDDVLADENNAVIEFMNDKYGLGLSAEDYQIAHPYWGFWEKVWGVSDEAGSEMHQAFVDSGVKRYLKVIPGAIEAINQLKQSYDLVVITSRLDSIIELTHEWLEEHFPETFKSVEFVMVWSDGDKKASKADIARSLDAEFLIDDSADHCRAADASGIKSLLFGTYGWNKEEKVSPNVTRVKDWSAVLEYFDAQTRSEF